MSNDNPSVEKLSRSEMITALSHYYRGEVSRSIAWRERLDRTTNWAVGAAAAFMGFAFSHPEIHHSLFLFAIALVYTLLYVEARRYRFFDAYEYRVRLLHQFFIYGILQGKLDVEGNLFWVAELASDLRYPQYKMDLSYAIGRRMKANYAYIFGILIAGWLTKIKIHPVSAHSWRQFLDHAALEAIPGWVTLSLIFLFAAHIVVLLSLASKPLGGRDLFHAIPPDRDKEL